MKNVKRSTRSKKKTAKRTHKRVRMPEDQLRELQKTFTTPIRQVPVRRRGPDPRNRDRVTMETFTTYGAYDDPF